MKATPASLVLATSLALAGSVLADENIDPTRDGSKHAYAENVGWLNAEPLGDGGPGMNVGDTALSGYLWSENVGWISLSCTNTTSCGTVDYAVSNDGNGALSGYGWGENVGWINFAPSGGGVSIDPATGIFGGLAWGENIGWITFGSSGAVPYRVRTSWPVGSLQFGGAAFGVAEGGGAATITVARAGGSRGAVGIAYSSSDGTAQAPGDYAPASGVVTFADGDANSKTFAVPIVSDSLAEGDESVNLLLGGPTGGAYLGVPSAALLTILDDPGRLQFSSASLTVAENAGPALITVARVGGAGGTVDVGFSTGGGTATPGTDYASVSGTVSFAPGDVGPRTFEVPVFPDLLTEGDETVGLALSGPTGGASLGTPATSVLTILDRPVPGAENIDPAGDGSKYAYGENVGWLNAEPLGPGGPGLRVGDRMLAGYLWSENVGWVSLSCANTTSCGTVAYGVQNDGSGTLSGYAWGENVGWINFGSTGAGVSIDPGTGAFAGRAWGENIGWVTFGSSGPVSYGTRAGCPDVDGDAVPMSSFLCPGGSPADCNDGDAQNWATPGEVRNVLFSGDRQTIAWTSPIAPGSATLLYDTIRSSFKSDFVGVGTCVETNDGADTLSVDTTTPLIGSAFFYLVRAENGCPSGLGSLGFRSDGTPRSGRDCP